MAMKELDLLSNVSGQIELQEREDVEYSGDLHVEVMKVAGDLGVPEKKPEPARLEAEVVKVPGAVDKNVELLETSRRRRRQPKKGVVIAAIAEEF